MKLTNDMRTEALNAMVADAVAKHAEPLCARFKQINDDFWEDYQRHVEIQTGVNRALWGKMFQMGMLHGTGSIMPERPEGDEDNRHWSVAVHSELSSPLRRILPALRNDPRWAQVKAMCIGKHWKRDDDLYFRFQSERTVPNIRDFERLPAECPHVIALEQAVKALEEVCQAASEFKSKCYTVLWACKTLKQLEAVMPDALPYFPTPVVEQKLPMPIAAAQELSAALKAGVPQEITA